MEQLSAQLDILLQNNYPVGKNILTRLPLLSLLNLCATDSKMSAICQQDYIWRERLIHDFPLENLTPPNNLSMKDYYIESYKNSTPTQLYVDDVLVDNFRILNDNIAQFSYKLNSRYTHDIFIIYADINGNVVAFSSGIRSVIIADEKTAKIYIYTSPDETLMTLINTYLILEEKSIANPNSQRQRALASFRAHTAIFLERIISDDFN